MQRPISKIVIRVSMGAPLVITSAMMWPAFPGYAQFGPPPQPPVAVAAGAEKSPLPLRDVVLFSSGVGYFQHAGTIAGATSIALSFRTEQINDILKSLVLFDSNGDVRPVTYTTKDSLPRRLSAAGVDINGTATLGTLLRQFQGAGVRLVVRVPKGADETVEGRILSISAGLAPQPSDTTNGDTTVTNTPTDDTSDAPRAAPKEVLNILVTSGPRPALRAVALDNVRQIELLDDHLNSELQSNLQLMATGLDEQRRTVQIAFGGNGSREVRAGYLEEMPIWKTSYRLVLDKNQKPYLQGWGIVENTTDEDWKDIHLSLVSGQPISFIQDLYQPLYIARPEVQAQVVGSPLPQTYGERIDSKAGVAPASPPAVMVPQPSLPAARPAADYASTASIAGAASEAGPAGAVGPAGAGMNGNTQLYASDGRVTNHRREDIALSAKKLAQSIAAQAQGAERGQLFEYSISQPVTLPRQQAAMVPIVSQSIDGERVSIYDPSASDKLALNGFRLKNTTGLHLSGGPITVFQEGVYAGDAQTNNIQPGEDRLISYAVDLDLVVDHKQPEATQEISAISIKKGVLFSTQKERQVNLYTFRNKSATAKTVLAQQAIQPEFKLISPTTATEKTAEVYRFKVAVPANKTAELKVVTEHPQSEEVALLDESLDTLVEYAHDTQVSPSLRAALGQIVARRRKLGEARLQRINRENEIKTISQEQSRIRQNMAQLNRNNGLYLQYVQKLTTQESRIEKLRAEIRTISANEAAARRELANFVDGLTVE